QEQLRAGCERRAEGQRRTIEDRRIASSETRVRQQNLTEQLRELDAEPETVLGGLRPEASE
ncbi:MAG TPA: hypothetical protein DCQ84_01940, partial [Candidatus Competibacteraceae bacterium]|nr:hypothetical protein [Candidatus Competibacteraceae bacterium]